MEHLQECHHGHQSWQSKSVGGVEDEPGNSSLTCAIKGDNSRYEDKVDSKEAVIFTLGDINNVCVKDTSQKLSASNIKNKKNVEFDSAFVERDDMKGMRKSQSVESYERKCKPVDLTPRRNTLEAFWRGRDTLEKIEETAKDRNTLMWIQNIQESPLNLQSQGDLLK